MRLFSLRCPRCGSLETRPSWIRTRTERWFSYLVVPYRCEGCDWRFFRFRPARADRTAK